MNLNTLKKQAPEERTKELKKIITQTNQEIKEKENLLKEAEKLLKETEEEQKTIEKVQIPIEQNTLEETTAKTFTELRLPNEPEQLAKTPIQEIYNEVKNIYETKTTNNTLTYEEREKQRLQLYTLNKAIDEKREKIKKGTYKPTEKAEHLITATEEIINKMYNK